MRITKWSEYAVLCCLYLSKHAEGHPAGSKELSTFLDIPAEYVQQIFQKLIKANIVNSVRGPGGGYILARTPELITMKDILYAAEGDTLEILCDHNLVYSACSDHGENCSLRHVWIELKQSIDDLLAKKTLKSILDQNPLDPIITLPKKKQLDTPNSSSLQTPAHPGVASRK